MIVTPCALWGLHPAKGLESCWRCYGTKPQIGYFKNENPRAARAVQPSQEAQQRLQGVKQGEAVITQMDVSAEGPAEAPWNEDTEIAVVGGGVCGVICAGRCAEKGVPYTIIERQPCYGGVWSNLANANSALQARQQQKTSLKAKDRALPGLA